MATPPFRDKGRKMLLALAAAGACLAFSSAKPFDVDISLHSKSGRALVSLGFASIEVAFDSGQECPNSNGCTGAIL